MTESINDSYNKVLLDSIGFLKKEVDGKTTTIYYDGSGLFYQIEELIALGAMYIAIQDLPYYRNIVKTLPMPFQKRIIYIDPKPSKNTVLALMNPIFKEFNIECRDDGSSFIIREDKSGIASDIPFMQFELYRFFLGLKSQLQIDININKVKQTLAQIRNYSTNPQVRVNVALLCGIFETYRHKTLDSISLRSTASPDLIQIFKEFVEDETYKQLSMNSHSIGFPMRIQRALKEAGRIAKRLFKKKAFKSIIDLSTKSLQVATQIPTPDSKFAEELLQKEYLPPIVSLSSTIERAEQTWKRINPDPIKPKLKD